MSQFRAAAAKRTAKAGSNAQTRGLSLIECLCGLCITAFLLSGALPAMRDLLHRQALHSVAALLETDVQYARSLARTTSRTVRLALRTATTGSSCYVIHSGPPEACRCDPESGTAVCEGDGHLLRLQALPATRQVRMTSASHSIVFDAGKGTVTPTATFVLADPGGRAVHQIVNILGRTRSCSPSGLAGYRACT